MKRRDFIQLSLGAGLAASLPLGLSSCTGKNKTAGAELSGPADLLVLGNIITIDNSVPFADAMTIKNGYVQYVGNVEGAKRLCNENTKVLDYGSNSVYPGFMEAHCHGAGAGMLSQCIRLYDAKSYKEYQDIIADYIAKHPDQEFYRIAGWCIQDSILPTKALLDEVCTDKAVFGSSLDGHCFLANSKAIELLKIDRAMAEEFGPLMVPVDAEGNPTGYVSETPCMKLLNSIPYSVENMKEFILSWEKFAFSCGYVAAADAGVNLITNAPEAYSELSKEGKLRLRTRAFYNVVQDDASEETVEKVVAMKKDDNEYFKIVGLKIFIDGVVESHTGLLCEDYADAPGKGLNRYPDKEKLQNLVLSAHRHGLPTHTHTIGDGAVRYMLDAIEHSKKITGNMNIRDMLAHIELVKPEDVKRFAKNNVSAITAALWAPKDSISSYKQEVLFLGKERADNNYEVANSFVEVGVNVAQHTDYPVSQSVGIPRTIYYAVTRMVPELGEQSIRIAKEAVSRMEALREMTINVAYLWNEEDHLGSLTPGKVANFVVYDKDFIDDDLKDILDARLKHVFVDGEEVYSE